MRSQHIWTEKDEEGRKREVRVTKFGGVWKFQAKCADEDRGPITIGRCSKICAHCARLFFGNINGAARRRKTWRRSINCCARIPAMNDTKRE